MLKKIQKICTRVLLPLVAVVCLLSGQVQASEYECTVSIPVETTISGDQAPSGTEFQIVLEAVDEDYPMPETTSVTVNDSEKINFGPITYTVPEDYQYRVYQKSGNAKNYTYDTTVYTVTVRVTNIEEGGLNAEIWAIKDGEQNKTDAIRFVNQYKAPKTTTTAAKTVKTGDSMNVALWAGLAAVAVLIMIVLLMVKRHHLCTLFFSGGERRR